MLYYCTARLNQLPACYSQLMLILLYTSLGLVVSEVKLWTVIAQEKVSLEICTVVVVLC